MGRASDPKEQKEERRYQASQRAASRFLERLAGQVEYLGRYLEDPPDGETFINSINFKIGGSWNDTILVIVKGSVGGVAVVGFHGADTLEDALMGLAGRLSNGTMKWREDTPYAAGN